MTEQTETQEVQPKLRNVAKHDAKPQHVFKGREDYLAFRANWRTGYRRLSNDIRITKAGVRITKNDPRQNNILRSILPPMQVQARSMMMALDAAKAQRPAPKAKPEDGATY